jgi:hypothetical protein
MYTFLFKKLVHAEEILFYYLEQFNLENVELLWRRAPPPAPRCFRLAPSPSAAGTPLGVAAIVASSGNRYLLKICFT